MAPDRPEELRAERGQLDAFRFIAQAGELLSSSLDFEATLTTLTGLIVPALGDWCIVDMLEPDGTIRQLAVAHRDPERMELIRELRRRFPPDWSQPHPITRVLATGQAEVASTITDRTYPLTSPGDPENQRILAALGLCSHIVAPLVAKGRTLGALSVISGESGRRYGEEDLALVQEIARRAGAAVENARLYLDAQAARDRLAFLAEASAVLGGSLDYGRTLGVVARLAVPKLADWCAVDMATEWGELEQVAVAHVDPSKVELAHEYRRRYPRSLKDPTGVPAVIRTERPQLVPSVTDEMLRAVAADERQLEMMWTLGIASVMVVPLTVPGRTLGALTLVRSDPKRPFDEADLELAVELARRAATAVDNARLYRERSRIAETLQHSLLPPALPAIPGFDVAARYLPAGEGIDVGGDFYDLFQTGERRWALVIGDVCGKGVDAAALTGLTRYTIRATAQQRDDPEYVLNALNGAVLAEQGEADEGRLCTVVYGSVRLERDHAIVSVTCAGHPLPVVLRADGTTETLGSPGTMLGVLSRPHLEERSAWLSPGDAVVLFTDGIVERRRGAEWFGEEGLRAALAASAGAGAAALAEAVERTAVAFGEGGPKDDMAVLVLRMDGAE